MAFDNFMSGAKKFGSGVLQGTIGTDFGLGGGPTAAGAAVKRTPNQTAPVGTKAPANPNGVAPYMKPSAQGPAISGPANEAIKKKRRKAPGQIGGQFEQEMNKQSGGELGRLEKMEGVLGEFGLEEETKQLAEDIEQLEPIQQMEKDAIDAGADTAAKDEFDLQDFGRLLSSVSGGRQGKAPMHQVSSSRGGGGYQRRKGLWDQRIMKEWMDIYNKPLYTPLHKVAAAMR